MKPAVESIGAERILASLGLEVENPGGFGGKWIGSGDVVVSTSPIDGEPIASVRQVTPEEYDSVVQAAHAAFLKWRLTPAPKRGETIRVLGNLLREKKKDLGSLVTLENGKIQAEGEGEVQEMIDICDFAVGLSRQLYGLSMHSERPGHRMYEQWHPLGVVGVISAFNFPVAVWCWNAAVANVCGDAVLWKPSSQTPLTAIACTRIAQQACAETGADPALFSMIVGRGSTIGDTLLHDARLPLVSATGSCKMGYRVAEVVGKRLGRTILELGGNNAIIVSDKANLDLAVPAIVFGAVGTAGQRCTSTRRIIAHRSIRDELVERLRERVLAGANRQPAGARDADGPAGRHVCGRDDDERHRADQEAGRGDRLRWRAARRGRVPGWPLRHPVYRDSGVAASVHQGRDLRSDSLRPFLRRRPREALEIHNGVPQGLSSAIFTNDLQEAERFLSHAGSDCGIANVNIGTSGAEIGGAFGGEKETGGGRESGSDAWKAYMRRQTNTINYSSELPLAQGIKFGAS